MKGYQLKVFAGRSNPVLGKGIIAELGIEPGDIEIIDFSDGETFVQINENVRGADVFAVQSLCRPGNANIMELLIMMDAFRRASAERITAVIPYFAYARQDRKVQPRVPITAKLLANLIVAAGADRIIAMDLHAGQIQGFFDIPVDHLYAAPVLVQHYRQKQLKELVVVAPDVGSAKMARGFAKRLDASLAIIDKRRPSANVAEVVNVVGEVSGRDCLIVDDMIDTGGTMAEATIALDKLGASNVYCCATHPLLSGPAIDRLRATPVREVAVTNTIQVPEEKMFDRLKVLSIGPLLAQAIRYTHSDQSVSSLFG